MLGARRLRSASPFWMTVPPSKNSPLEEGAAWQQGQGSQTTRVTSLDVVGFPVGSPAS